MLRRLSNEPLALLALQLAAFWPVWRWYLRRLADPCDEAWGLVPLVVVVGWAISQYGRRNKSSVPTGTLTLATILTACYAALVPFAPPLARALIAVTALSATVSTTVLGKTLSLPVTGLLALALPVIPSAQFYFGYPLRVFVATVAVPFLRAAGLAVARQGTCLAWNGRLISVDAPCSGISMLWTGAFLACALSLLHELSDKQSFLTGLAALVAVLSGNILRTTTLFVVETGSLAGTPYLHEGVGLVIFAATAAFIAGFSRWLRSSSSWPARTARSVGYAGGV